MSYKMRWVQSWFIYALLLLGSICAMVGVAWDPYGGDVRLKNALTVVAGLCFITVFVVAMTRVWPVRDVKLAGRLFAYEPRGSIVRVVLIGLAVLVLVFVFEILPRLMGLDVELVMHIIVAASVALYGYLAYVEFRGKRKDKD